MDLMAEHTSRQAVLTALQTGQPTLSKRLPLLQALPKPADFLYLLPLYRPAARGEAPQLRGVLFAVVVAPDALKEVIASGDTRLDLEVFDGEIDASSLLFDLGHHGHSPSVRASAASGASSPGSVTQHAGASFMSTRPVQVGGRNLYLRTASTASFDAAYATQQPRMLAASGGVLTLLCTLCTWLLVSSRTRVQALASAMTVIRSVTISDSRRRSQSVTSCSHTRKGPGRM